MKLKYMLQAVTAAAAIVAGMMVIASPASARMVCNGDGDCWHTDSVPRAPGVHFDVHPDDWYFHQRWDSDRDHRYRDYHEGRGYYRNGVWITL